MYFKPELIALIEEGKKTQTRRLCKPSETGGVKYPNDDRLHWGFAPQIPLDSTMGMVKDRNGRRKWAVGQTLAIAPGRGKHGVGFIKLISIGIAHGVSDISDADALAEGFNSRDEFLAKWDEINGTGKRDLPVWILSFVYIGATRDGKPAPALQQSVTLNEFIGELKTAVLDKNAKKEVTE